MKNFAIKELAEITGAEKIGQGDGFFTGVSIDSRTVSGGDCFFAIKGKNFDGADYIEQAFANGACCAVVNKKTDKISEAGWVLKVDDTVKALGDLARQYRRAMGFKVVSVTGSVGKTTTSRMIHHVLQQEFACHCVAKSFNNDIGLPLTILGSGDKDKIVITELGSNYPGEIEYLSKIAQPDIAVVLNVYPAHLAGFGSIENIIREKVSIAQGLDKGGKLIINGDIESLVEYCKVSRLSFEMFGTSSKCDIHGENIIMDGFGSRFQIEGREIFVPLAGEGNIKNAIAAWAVCRRLGITIDKFSGAMRTMPMVGMRLQPINIGPVTVLNDCYNANPASMKNALDLASELGREKKLRSVFICGPMLELGDQSEQLHIELGRHIAEAKIELLLATGQFGQITAEAAKRAANYDLRTEYFANTGELCNNLGKFLKPDDIILVKGSRSSKLESVIEKIKALFGQVLSDTAGGNKV